MPDLEVFEIEPSENEIKNAFGQLKYFGTIMLKSLTIMLDENNNDKQASTTPKT